MTNILIRDSSDPTIIFGILQVPCLADWYRAKDYVNKTQKKNKKFPHLIWNSLKEYFNTKHIEYNFIKHNEEVRL
jgi:hypothetical protein